MKETRSARPTRLRRLFPAVAVLTGCLLVAHALYLGLNRPGLLGGVPLAQFVPAPQLLFGLALVTVGWSGRTHDLTPVLGTLLVLAAVIALTGPTAPWTLGLVQWTVLVGAVVVCVGLPSVVLVTADLLDGLPEIEPIPTL